MAAHLEIYKNLQSSTSGWSRDFQAVCSIWADAPRNSLAYCFYLLFMGKAQGLCRGGGESSEKVPSTELT